mmetsp:Transcript_24797/g.69777  ORF Transcript_24797/g.69777 Transcript_24797/m.69777 type:complete len:113 (+) Transcript_24797:78-416(+)
MRAFWQLLFIAGVFGAAVHAADDLGEDAAEVDAEGGEDEDETPEEIMKQLDKNGDGKLAMEEIPTQADGSVNAKVAEAFKASDSDGDGLISIEELPILMQKAEEAEAAGEEL